MTFSALHTTRLSLASTTSVSDLWIEDGCIIDRTVEPVTFWLMILLNGLVCAIFVLAFFYGEIPEA